MGFQDINIGILWCVLYGVYLCYINCNLFSLLDYRRSAPHLIQINMLARSPDRGMSLAIMQCLAKHAHLRSSQWSFCISKPLHANVYIPAVWL